jgi:hypothetical protein
VWSLRRLRRIIAEIRDYLGATDHRQRCNMRAAKASLFKPATPVPLTLGSVAFICHGWPARAPASSLAAVAAWIAA